MARRVAKKKTSKKTAAFKTSVVINASFKREYETLPDDYAELGDNVYDDAGYVEKVWLDQKRGYLYAAGGCETKAFLCTIAEIPALVAFLAEIVEANKANDSD